MDTEENSEATKNREVYLYIVMEWQNIARQEVY